MAGAGGDLTTTVATAPTRITLVATIGVIITTNLFPAMAVRKNSLTAA